MVVLFFYRESRHQPLGCLVLFALILILSPLKIFLKKYISFSAVCEQRGTTQELCVGCQLTSSNVV
jgi:hypothetical protein